MKIIKNTTTFWWSECSPRFSSKSWWGPGHMAQDHWSPSNDYKRSRHFI